MFPEYQEIRVPLLAELARRGGASKPSDVDHAGRTIPEALADLFGLSDEARKLRIWDEKAGIFRSKWYNMIRWTRSDLRKLGYLYAPARGVWAISEAGRELLAEIEKEEVGHGVFAPGLVIDPVTFRQRYDRAQRVGALGEQFVLNYERRELNNAERYDLADKVRYIAIENVAAGYDILSYDNNGSEKYIEVKTTSVDSATFYWTENEKRVAGYYREAYWIYRVTRIESDSPSIFTIQNPSSLVEEGSLWLRPTQYEVRMGESLRQ